MPGLSILQVILIRIESPPPMYVCICNAITERDVRAQVSQGCRSVAQVYRGLNCKPQCCKCVDDIRRVVDGTEALSLAGTPHR